MMLHVELHTFERGSAMHLLAVAACLSAAAGACLLGRRWRDRQSGAEQRLRRAWAIFTLATQFVVMVWWLLPANFSWRVSLPLHICDVTAVLAAAAMITRRRWVWSVVYFWGIGLSLVAFITPVLTDGPAHLQFYFFWLTHLQIVGSAAYLVVVMGFRPTWRDWRVATALLAAYFALVVPVNVALGTYYGYVGPGASMADVLGPWPWRALVIFALQVAALTLLAAPWTMARR